MAKTNWGMVALGVGLMLATTADIVPGDEVIGIPLGAALVAKGVNII